MPIFQRVYKRMRIRTKTDAFLWTASIAIVTICFAHLLVDFFHNGYPQLSVAHSVIITTALITVPSTYWASYQLYLIYKMGIKFKSQAEIDALTGVKTRRFLFDRLSNKLNTDSSHYALLMVDVDHFKSINDDHNHTIGDEVLKHVAATMIQACRQSDVVCRFGGEEFVVILPDCDFDVGKIVAERIRSRIASKDFRTTDVRIPVTVSIGIAEGHPSTTMENVIQVADDALYMAKEGGRNRIVLNAPAIETPEQDTEDSNDTRSVKPAMVRGA